MKALELLINGKRRCLAGSGLKEFTWVMVNLDERGTGIQGSVNVAGSRKKTTPIWIEEDPIQIGDEVTVRIVDVDPSEIDEPVQAPLSWTEFPQGKIPDREE
jgi:hypothetical protein